MEVGGGGIELGRYGERDTEGGEDFSKQSLPSAVPSVRQSACLIGGRVGV